MARLRKFLKTRRVTSVAQIGTDRIIELQFSDGQYRLFLEFYAGGNIVLADRDLSIISLLRVVHEDNEELRVGSKYLLESRQNYGGIPELTTARVRAGLQKASEKTAENVVPLTKKSTRKPGDVLRKGLATSLNELPPILIEHALRVKDFDTSTRIEDVLNIPSVMERLMDALQQAEHIASSITTVDRCKGYIIAKAADTAAAGKYAEKGEQLARGDLLYEDFHPFKPRQIEDESDTIILEINGFNKTVDEFFSSIESQKLESRLTEREEKAKRKLESARSEQEKRIGGLQQVQELNVRKAEAIEANLQKVHEAIYAINGLLAQGMDWQDIARLIEMEQEKNNVVAEMIKLPLKLNENTATLLLAEAFNENQDDYDGDETGSDVSSSENEAVRTKSAIKSQPSDKRLTVDVDLSLSPWSNARQYYDQKKFAAVKKQKTFLSSEKALKSTEKKVTADLKKGLKQEKDVMRPQRTANWFEKFVYFISSEGYLVLAGKDAQQNEILYQRYLKRGDAYVHAEINGATSVLAKNKPGMSDSPIPPSTLSQAGTLAVATSSAWDSKAVIGAWWVHAEQVSKIASTGEFLTTGVFTIRGRKNHLPPAQLLLGFGIMFKISEESKARHLKYRFQEEGAKPINHKITDSNEVNDDQDQEEGEEDSTVNQTNNTVEEDDDDASTHSDGSGVNLGKDREHENDDEQHENKPSSDNPLHPKGSRSEESQTLDRDEYEPTPPDLFQSNGDTGSNKSSKEFDERVQEEERNDIRNALQPEDGRNRHILARERRLLRQGMSTQIGRSPSADENAISEEGAGVSTPATSQQSLIHSQPPGVRGKHGKRNKLKTKYANQDEEDRAMAMRLLGSAAAQKKAIEDAANKASKEEEMAAAKERRRKQHALAAEKGKEAEEIRRRNFEEGFETLDENEVQGLGGLDAFIGSPLPGDEILDALIVCGPWDAIGGRCRWRVKLQPGTIKKGKAVREILGKWTVRLAERDKKKRPRSGEGNETMAEEEEMRSREAELIRAIREPEVIGVVPVGKVRLVMGSGDSGGKGRGGIAAGKGKRGGKGSKKQR